MTVYIEGGGDGRSLRARFREGWRQFLQSAGAGRVKIVRGGGREQTGFRENAIRDWPAPEDVPKATVLEALDRATASCSRRYVKGRASFELLARIDPARVEAACPHARALLNRLRAS